MKKIDSGMKPKTTTTSFGEFRFPYAFPVVQGIRTSTKNCPHSGASDSRNLTWDRLRHSTHGPSLISGYTAKIHCIPPGTKPIRDSLHESPAQEPLANTGIPD